jgi:hypothetical protein
MQINCIIASFDLDEGDSLKPLLEQGYSVPTKTENGMMTTRQDFVNSAGAEVERIGNNAFVTIRLNSARDADDAVREVFKTFEKAGLL